MMDSVALPKLTDNGLAMNVEGGWIYRTASLKIKLAGPVVKLKSIQKYSGLLFTKGRRDKVRQLRRQEHKPFN
jgi:hypothetical protein